jgi:hypothetical protein
MDLDQWEFHVAQFENRLVFRILFMGSIIETHTLVLV